MGPFFPPSCLGYLGGGGLGVIDFFLIFPTIPSPDRAPRSHKFPRKASPALRWDPRRSHHSHLFKIISSGIVPNTPSCRRVPSVPRPPNPFADLGPLAWSIRENGAPLLENHHLCHWFPFCQSWEIGPRGLGPDFAEHSLLPHALSPPPPSCSWAASRAHLSGFGGGSSFFSASPCGSSYA